MPHTNGNQFLLNDIPYIGVYHKGPGNEYFTGESYIFGISQGLTVIDTESEGVRIGDENYDKLQSNFSERDINYAKDYYPQINDNNIKSGFVARHFVRQWNDMKARIIEISPKQSGIIDKGFYKVIKINWKITGDIEEVSEHNAKTIDIAKKIMPKISLKLNNTIELYNSEYSDII